MLVMYLVISVLMMVLAVPLIQKRVRPNWFYGFRTPKTLSSPDIWYPANVYAGKVLFATGLLLFFAALIFYFIPGMSEDGYGIAVALVMLVLLLPGMVLMLRYLRKL